MRVPPQRRVAMASGNVPDFHGAVVAAASDKFAVRRKSNGVDTVIETSEHMKHTGTSKDNQKKTYSSECPVRVDSTNPVRASQTTTRHPSARASLDPSGEKATARITSPPRIVNLHARRLCRGLTRSMKA